MGGTLAGDRAGTGTSDTGGEGAETVAHDEAGTMTGTLPGDVAATEA